VDGAGKDSVAKAALLHISQDRPASHIVKLGRPAYAFHDGQVTQVYKRVSHGFDRLNELADSFHNSQLVMAANGLSIVTQTRIFEQKALHKNPAQLIVASGRDPLIDPAVYFSYYASRASKNVDVATRLRTMGRLTGVRRDLVVMLRVDPEVAIQRIDARIEESRLREDGESRHLPQPGRAKNMRHIHENVRDLATISQNYDHVLACMQTLHPETAVVEINTTERTKDEVADLAYTAITQTMSGAIEPGEWIRDMTL
jgi:hypothetical protein